MKLALCGGFCALLVTSHVEVWIETQGFQSLRKALKVTSHVEVWIETHTETVQRANLCVTSHVEVWIETTRKTFRAYRHAGHLPRGGVD